MEDIGGSLEKEVEKQRRSKANTRKDQNGR